jgi:cobalt-zinc-cadmium efflux system outer membrane protein
MTRRVNTISLMVISITGCATVDPRADFDRASRHVERATGKSFQQLEGDQARQEAIVADLLEGGLGADEAVRIALLNNATVRAGLASIGIARADAVQAGLFSNPTLGLTFKLPESGGLADLEAGLAQNIADLWLIPPRKKAAERDVDRTILQTAREIVALTNDTKMAYYNAIAADEAFRIARDNVSITKRLFEITDARLEAGTVGSLDVNLARAQSLRADVDYRTARLEASSARRTLGKRLALTMSTDDIPLTDPLPLPQERSIDPERLVMVARESRLDILAAQENVAAAEARIKSEYARVFPNVDIGIDFERGERRALPGRDILADTARASIANGGLTAPDIESRGQRAAAKRQEIDYTLGPSLGLTLPIFDQNQAQIAKAQFAHQEALALLEALNRSIVQETREAVDRALTAWDIATLFDRELLPQARDTLNISESAYQAGNTPILNVIEAQRSLLEATRARIVALQTAANALIDLERAIARPIDEVLLSQKETTPPEGPSPITSAPDSQNSAGDQP